MILSSGTQDTTEILGAYTVQAPEHVVRVAVVVSAARLEMTRISSMYAFSLERDDSYVLTGACGYDGA